VNEPSPRSGLLYTALAVAVLSLGVALFALLRPAGDPEYTDAQRGDAKAATDCQRSSRLKRDALFS